MTREELACVICTDRVGCTCKPSVVEGCKKELHAADRVLAAGYVKLAEDQTSITQDEWKDDKRKVVLND